MSCDERGREQGNELGVYWCVGMYASASTWLYNAVCGVVTRSKPSAPLRRLFVDKLKHLKNFDPRVAGFVIKSHYVEPDAAEIVMNSASAIFLSVRDPRDCVASLMRHHGEGFEEALESVAASARFCERLRHAPRSRVFTYEARFMDAPGTIASIAALTGLPVSSEAAEGIFSSLQRHKVEELISKLDTLPGRRVTPNSDDTWDDETHWHRHHANRDGRSGIWRDCLTEEQTAAVDERLADWMPLFGYSRGRDRVG